MDLKHLIFRVLFYLAGGTFVSFGALRQTEVGTGYFQVHGLGALVIAVLAYVFLGRAYLGEASIVWFFAFILFGSLYCLPLGQGIKVKTAGYFLGVISFFACLFLNIEEGIPTHLTHQLIANSLQSSLLLGFTLAAMMLGHWYLIQPKLSIDELMRTVVIMITLTVVRFFWATYQMTALLWPLSEADLYRYLVRTPGIFVLMRYLWGCVGPLVLSYLVYKTVKIRSTQSATGILYVSVVGVLIGEILSLYLAFFHGIPL